jgi:hypothetical protein
MTFLPAMAVNFWKGPLPPSGRNICYVLISGARTALVGKYPGANGAPNASKGIRKADAGNPADHRMALGFLMPRNVLWMLVLPFAGRCRIEPVLRIGRLWNERSRSGEHR